MKASDNQILHSVKQLRTQRKDEWAKQFGEDDSPFLGFRRATIQEQLQQDFNISYSDGGMRGRLKRMVEDGVLEKFRLFERVTFYSLTNKKGE